MEKLRQKEGAKARKHINDLEIKEKRFRNGKGNCLTEIHATDEMIKESTCT